MGESPAAAAESTDYAVFEWMFRRALRVEPNSPLADALRDGGVEGGAERGVAAPVPGAVPG
jgi:hypothetical protein